MQYILPRKPGWYMLRTCQQKPHSVTPNTTQASVCSSTAEAVLQQRTTATVLQQYPV
jgi:hypothetical protein